MNEPDWLAERFEENRPHLRAVAYRMLGASGVAEDAVQEAWLRLSRSDTSGVENLRGWLTTVVSRVCLDMLRSRKARREDAFDPQTIEPVMSRGEGSDPERDAVLADSVGLALLAVLNTLDPAERVAFVLHDMFDLPFDDIAPIVGRSEAAARKLASRARQRMQGGADVPRADLTRQRHIVEAFLTASRTGDFVTLLSLLDPNVILRSDATVVAMGGNAELRGANAVAETFKGRAQVAKSSLIDGQVGAVFSAGGKPRVVFSFTIEDGKIVGIELLADPDRLSRMELAELGA